MMNKKISSKKLIKYFLSLLFLFILYHLIVWYLYTSKIFNLSDDYMVGDLGRMSYQVDLLDKRKTEYTLKKRHINKSNWDNQKINIITLGDSFSNAGGGGLNPYYQDYLASQYNINVLNMHTKKDYSDFETILALLNSGELKRLKPKAILIQSVQRGVIEKYSHEIIEKENISKIELLIAKNTKEIELPNVLIINTANYKLPFYRIKYNFNNNAIKSVYKLTLNKNLFSVKEKNKILIYKDDIHNIPQFTSSNIEQLNNNFNFLAHKLKKINIKLIFMPTVDKYDLYHTYISNNTLPKNNFFDILRPMKKEYYFIDTKKILTTLLDNNIKDIYYVDDTHWSYIASEAIIKDKIFNDNF